jgi:hypothetical protein
MLRRYFLRALIENSEGLRSTPQAPHLSFTGRKISFIDFRHIILLMMQPHLSHTISIDEYDILINLICLENKKIYVNTG